MTCLAISCRDGESNDLGLGAVLAIVLGGAVVALLISIGIWMAWRVRVSQKASDIRLDDILNAFSQPRLDEAQLLEDESTVHTQSSLASIPSPPSPGLPTTISLPSLSSCSGLKSLLSPNKSRDERKRSWTSGYDLHSPQTSIDAGKIWTRKDDRCGEMSSMRNLVVGGKGRSDGQCEPGKEPQRFVRQHPRRQKQGYKEYRKQQQQPRRQYEHYPYQRQYYRCLQQDDFYVQDYRGVRNAHDYRPVANVALYNDTSWNQQFATWVPAQAHARPLTTKTDDSSRCPVGASGPFMREVSRSPTGHESPSSRYPVKTGYSHRRGWVHQNGQYRRGTPILNPIEGGHAAIPTFVDSSQVAENMPIAEATNVTATS